MPAFSDVRGVRFMGGGGELVGIPYTFEESPRIAQDAPAPSGAAIMPPEGG
jgi:hypothetical protein